MMSLTCIIDKVNKSVQEYCYMHIAQSFSVTENLAEHKEHHSYTHTHTHPHTYTHTHTYTQTHIFARLRTHPPPYTPTHKCVSVHTQGLTETEVTQRVELTRGSEYGFFFLYPFVVSPNDVVIRGNQAAQAQVRIIRDAALSTHRGKNWKCQETPLMIYTGLKIFFLTRSRQLIDGFFKIGFSVSDDRVLELTRNLYQNLHEAYSKHGCFWVA